jgi:hypothetical protein
MAAASMFSQTFRLSIPLWMASRDGQPTGKEAAKVVFDSAVESLKVVFRPAVVVMSVYSSSADPFELPSEELFRKFAQGKGLHVLKYVHHDGYRHRHCILLSRRPDLSEREIVDCLVMR